MPPIEDVSHIDIPEIAPYRLMREKYRKGGAAWRVVRPDGRVSRASWDRRRDAVAVAQDMMAQQDPLRAARAAYREAMADIGDDVDEDWLATATVEQIEDEIQYIADYQG